MGSGPFRNYPDEARSVWPCRRPRRRTVIGVNNRLDALALAGVAGPLAFISAWTLGALATGMDYSSIDDAISRLAAVKADTRWLMTAGFVVFGICLPTFGVVLRRTLSGWAWLAAVLTGLATLGVAATPLNRSHTTDALHGVFATAGYVSLIAVPLLAFVPLRQRHPRLAKAGLVAAAVSALSLALTVSGLPTGLFQRSGLTSTDVWIIIVASIRPSTRPKSCERGLTPYVTI
jgi:hypothetical membrane protein